MCLTGNLWHDTRFSTGTNIFVFLNDLNDNISSVLYMQMTLSCILKSSLTMIMTGKVASEMTDVI